MTEREIEIKKRLKEAGLDNLIAMAEDIAKDKEELDQMQRELEEKKGPVYNIITGEPLNPEAELLDYRVHMLFKSRQFIRVDIHPYTNHWPIQIYYPTDARKAIACFWSAWEFVYHWCNQNFKGVKDHIYVPLNTESWPYPYQPVALEDFSLAYYIEINGGCLGPNIYSEEEATRFERGWCEFMRLNEEWDLTNPEKMKDKKYVEECVKNFKEDVQELLGDTSKVVGYRPTPIASFADWVDLVEHYRIRPEDQVFDPILCMPHPELGDLCIEKPPRNPKWMIPHARCWWKFVDDPDRYRPPRGSWGDLPFESFEELRVRYRKVTQEELTPLIKEEEESIVKYRMTDAEMQKKFGNNWKKWRAPSQEEVEKMFKELEEEDRREGLEEAKRKEGRL